MPFFFTKILSYFIYFFYTVVYSILIPRFGFIFWIIEGCIKDNPWTAAYNLQILRIVQYQNHSFFCLFSILLYLHLTIIKQIHNKDFNAKANDLTQLECELNLHLICTKCYLGIKYVFCFGADVDHLFRPK